MNCILPPVLQMVSTPSPIKPEMYDGTKDWVGYQVYFDQLAQWGWDEERYAMMLDICLKGDIYAVFASLDEAQRRSYHSLTKALTQSFAPKELVHLYRAELKTLSRRQMSPWLTWEGMC